MICLGIESTAHTFGVGIVDGSGKVLANEKAIFTTESGGIRPYKAFEHHVLLAEFVLKSALQNSGVKLNDIDLIAFAQGPGLGLTLRSGAVMARTLSKLLKKPLIGVNHCIAHVEIGKQTSGFKDPITLYVSGANTQILAFAAGRYRVFGETLDTGVGNFLDNFGRLLGLGFPAGPKIDELAKLGKNYIPLNYTIKGMDFSFSGILTNAEKKIRDEREKNNWKISDAFLHDICYSVQETVFAILTEATERAIAHINKREILLTGGVAANTRLQVMLASMAKDRGVKFKVVPRELAGDNGAMIACAGILAHQAKVQTKDSAIVQNWRTDQVNAVWVK
ncbi:MAG: N(6)-L-threonylcarbamoyladenine synthase Kae1 [DPANN group archaeon]|nr:N(6)-L-threonylcarbamoyladenine synthase Kae1 [DPANN group archaeon]